MASELESLLVRLEGDTAGLRRALAQGESALGGHERKVSSTLANSDRSFDKFTKSVQGHMAKFLAVVGAAFTARFADQLIRSNNAMADLADTVGLTSQKFQELKVFAIDQGLGTDKLEQSLRKFAVGVGEARQRSGGFYEFLRQHLPTIATQIRATSNQSDALDVLVNAFQRIPDPANRSALANQAFGESGLQLALILAQGSDALKESARSAKEYRDIIGEDAIKATRELQANVDRLSNTVSAQLTKALAELAPYLNAAIKGMRDFIKYFSELSGKFNKDLGDIFGGGANKAEISGKVTASAFLNAIETTITKAPKLAELKFLPKPPDYTGVDALKAAQTQQLQLVIETEKAKVGIAASTTDLIRVEYEKDLENFRRLKETGKVTDAQFQAARVAYSAIAGEKIAAHLREQQDLLRSQLAPLSDLITTSISQPLDDAFTGNLKTAKEYFRTMLAGFAKLVTQALILKPLINSLTSTGSPLAFLGPILGAKANGGPVQANTPYLVGENGPEVVVPQTAGTVIPNHVLGGGGGSGAVYNIDARGADAGVEQRIYRALAAAESARQSPIAQVSAVRGRFPTRF